MKKHIYILGIIGLLAFCIGTLMPKNPNQNLIFFIGALFLLAFAYLSENIFFTMLEGTLAINTILIISGVGTKINSIITLTLIIISVFFFYMKGLLVEKNIYNGIIGLIFMIIGIMFSLPLSLVLSGVFLSIYSYNIITKEDKIGLIFFILNVMYVTTSLIGLFKSM